ncbi:MAG: hypothetical protein IJN24_02080 [Bacteroidaceae bacterium]|nr:hypothetical protein [Bacteroidaceae bacterium]MBR7167043.1 hypothetical protein [Bacteroidaceae bacterium]
MQRPLQILLIISAMLTSMATDTHAQTADSTHTAINNRMVQNIIAQDSLRTDSIYKKQIERNAELSADSSRVSMKRTSTLPESTKPRFIPDPQKATWLAVVFPGAGQIYNRKYWKLPIVYGGFIGCLYAFNWNSQMYSDYRQAFLDIMDADPNTDSYKDFFRPGYDFEKNEEYLKEVFKKRKDRYRRWRDLSVFAFIGVYALSVIDAYVDAQLASFDISDNINLTLTPQMIHDKNNLNPENNYYGFNCNITF